MAIRDYILSWGSLDEQFLDRLIEEWELDEDELIEKTKMFLLEIGSNETICSDINALIYQALLMIRDKIEEFIDEFISQLDDNKWDKKYIGYLSCIYANYLDSGLDDELYADEIVTKDGVKDEERLIQYLKEKGMIKEKE